VETSRFSLKHSSVVSIDILVRHAKGCDQQQPRIRLLVEAV